MTILLETTNYIELQVGLSIKNWSENGCHWRDRAMRRSAAWANYAYVS